MQVKTDSEGLIMAYALIGEIADGTDIIDELPANFVVDFQPGKFKLTNNGITVNDSYVEPVVSQPVSEPTAEQESLTAIAQQMADQQQHIGSLEQALTVLAQGGTK